jgi:spermidine/putrescine transport system permease protein
MEPESKLPFKKNYFYLAIYSGLVLIFLYIPLIVLSIASFKGGKTWYHWYQRAFSDPTLINALTNSLIVGFNSTLISTILGTTAALALRRKKFFGKIFFESIINLPLILPEIVMGLSLLVWFSFLKLTLGLFTVTLAHATFSLSYVIMIVYARIQTMDPLLEEAAADLGATPWNIFWKITFPQVLPAIISGALLSFTLSFDDFLITFFTSGVGSDTLPIRIYSMMRFGITPEMNAISSAVIFITFIAVIISLKLTSSKISTKQK